MRRLSHSTWLVLGVAVAAHAESGWPRCSAETDIDCFVAVAGGSFTAGAQATDPAAPRFDPLATASETLTPATVGAFEITAMEITRSAYAKCVGAGKCKAPPSDYYTPDVGRGLPVVGVTRAEADTFCRWIGGRLPTAHEWEFAARGGGLDQRYPWGSEPYCPNLTPDEDREREARLARLAAQCSPVTTHALPHFNKAEGKELSLLIDVWTDDEFLAWCKELGALPPASIEAATRAGMAARHVALAASDTLPTCGVDSLMLVTSGIPGKFGNGYAANASEWVSDDAPPAQPGGPARGIVRGGSFASDPREWRVTGAYVTAPDTRAPDIGFRCARAPRP